MRLRLLFFMSTNVFFLQHIRFEFFCHGLAVEKAEGVQRWALWMEISGRLQVAQSASKSVLRKDSTRDFVDEPGWALKNDR